MKKKNYKSAKSSIINLQIIKLKLWHQSETPKPLQTSKLFWNPPEKTIVSKDVWSFGSNMVGHLLVRGKADWMEVEVRILSVFSLCPTKHISKTILGFSFGFWKPLSSLKSLWINIQLLVSASKNGYQCVL